MQHTKIPKIYSISASTPEPNLIEVETIILNGLYKFSILGINQKNSSDIKDRVYSALRSQKLLNLKSDNKKITVNLLPTNIEKKSNVYDLGIALSCLVHMNQVELQENILAVGELSIAGNIIPSSCILKTIHQAIEHDVKIVICSTEDLEALNTYRNNINDLIEDRDIRFIAGQTLSEILCNIKDDTFYQFDRFESRHGNTRFDGQIDITEMHIFKIVLAICTNRNVFIENKKDSHLKNFLKNLIYYSNSLSSKDLVRLASRLDVTDKELLENYNYPIISMIDGQTQKDDLHKILNESLLGFNIMDDFTSIPEEAFHVIKKARTSSIVCFYSPCPCGNINNLFTSFAVDKCICLQRSILRHRQKLHRLENGFFDFYVKNANEDRINFSAADYVDINKIIHIFKNTGDIALEEEEVDKIRELYSTHYNKQEVEIDEIMILFKDTLKLQSILNKTKPAVSKDSAGLVLELIRKDF